MVRLLLLTLISTTSALAQTSATNGGSNAAKQPVPLYVQMQNQEKQTAENAAAQLQASGHLQQEIEKLNSQIPGGVPSANTGPNAITTQPGSQPSQQSIA